MRAETEEKAASRTAYERFGNNTSSRFLTVFPRGGRRIGVVWCEHHLLHFAQGARQWKRLIFEDVECGAGDASVPERHDEVTLVDQRAARGGGGGGGRARSGAGGG